MKISTKLFFAGFVPVLVALVIGSALIFSYLALETARDNGDKIRLVRDNLTELNHLIFSYVSYQEERPKQQFLAEHEKMTALLAGIHFRNLDQQQLVDEIRLNSQYMKEAFLRLVSNTEHPGPTGTERRLKYTERRLVGQLLIKSHNADSIASTLKSRIEDDLARTQKRTFALIFLLLGFTTIPVTVVLLQMRKKITKELTNLRQGTKIIGSGNLDHVITAKNDEEIGDLTNAFNRMTIKLKEVTVSKAELEREMAERKQAERQQHLVIEILNILNKSAGLTDTTNRIILAIKEETGFDAVGIRLRSGDDFPYFFQEGFSNDFLLAENTLAVHSKEGGVCRDENGNISLGCTCGLVLSGRNDPTNPLFTPGGSAWTNNALTLLDLSPDQDPRLLPRNRCVHEGFLSVALIPIRDDQEIIGLLQLNDRKKDRLTTDRIRFFEGLSDSIGVALKHRLTGEALRRSEARFRLLSETAGQLLATDNPQAAVNALCRRVMEHLDCHVFFNFLADGESGRLHLNACAGIPEEEVRKIEWLDYGVAVCGCVARDGVRLVAENIGLTPDPRTDLVHSYGVQAYACHPLLARGRLIGTLSFGTKTRTEFSPEDLALMRTVTDQVSTAMERIRLIRELQRSREELEMRVQERTAKLELLNQALKAENEMRLESEIELRESENRLRQLSTELLYAQEKERRLVAQDLHDSIGSSLAAIKFKVEAALLQTGNNTLQQEPALKGVIPAIQTAIQETRRIQKALRPPVLDDLGILATIRWFCREFESTYTAVRIWQEIDIEEEEVPDSLKIVIFRVLQEALNNIAKYSGAELARLSLRKAPGCIELVIEDQGQGFDLKEVLGSESTQRGLGLTSMRERTELSGGSIFIDSVRGKGTVIRAVWPV